jgi:hypothetical protein
MKQAGKTIFVSMFALLPAALALAQSRDQMPAEPAAQSSQGPARATPGDFSSGSNGTDSRTGEAAAGPGESVRGDGANTSDRMTSRTWTGVGSTGGATGTGVSSGTIADPAPGSGGASVPAPGGDRQR